MSNDEGPGDLRSLYVSASTKKAALTRARKALELSIGALSGTPASDHFFQQLKQNLEKYRLLRDEVLDIYDHIRFQVAEDKFTKDFGKQEKEIETDYERAQLPRQEGPWGCRRHRREHLRGKFKQCFSPRTRSR